MLSGPTSVKAVRRTLMKLSQETRKPGSKKSKKIINFTTNWNIRTRRSSYLLLVGFGLTGGQSPRRCQWRKLGRQVLLVLL